MSCLYLLFSTNYFAFHCYSLFLITVITMIGQSFFSTSVRRNLILLTSQLELVAQSMDSGRLLMVYCLVWHNLRSRLIQGAQIIHSILISITRSRTKMSFFDFPAQLPLSMFSNYFERIYRFISLRDALENFKIFES